MLPVQQVENSTQYESNTCKNVQFWAYIII